MLGWEAVIYEIEKWFSYVCCCVVVVGWVKPWYWDMISPILIYWYNWYIDSLYNLYDIFVLPQQYPYNESPLYLRPHQGDIRLSSVWLLLSVAGIFLIVQIKIKSAKIKWFISISGVQYIISELEQNLCKGCSPRIQCVTFNFRPFISNSCWPFNSHRSKYCKGTPKLSRCYGISTLYSDIQRTSNSTSLIIWRASCF